MGSKLYAYPDSLATPKQAIVEVGDQVWNGSALVSRAGLANKAAWQALAITIDAETFVDDSLTGAFAIDLAELDDFPAGVQVKVRLFDGTPEPGQHVAVIDEWWSGQEVSLAGEQARWIRDYAEADEVVDKLTNPAHFAAVRIKRGTGTLTDEDRVEISRRLLFDVNGQPLSSPATRIGRLISDD